MLFVITQHVLQLTTHFEIYISCVPIFYHFSWMLQWAEFQSVLVAVGFHNDLIAFKEKPSSCLNKAVASLWGTNMDDVNWPLLSLWKHNEIFGISVDSAVGNLKRQTVQPTPQKPLCQLFFFFFLNECVSNKRGNYHMGPTSEDQRLWGKSKQY